MATFHIDLVNGSDANDGSSGAPWRTVTNGATAARIAPGDFIKIGKTGAPASIGNGTWTIYNSIGTPAVPGITSSTNASPIVITRNSHGFTNGQIVQITAHSTNTAANGFWKVANATANTFELEGSVGNGVGGATGNIQLSTSRCIQLASSQVQMVNPADVATLWTGAGDTTVAVVLAATDSKTPYGCLRFTLDSTPTANTLQAYRAMSATDFSGKQKISFWIKNSAAILANQWNLTLCSDAAGATPVDTFAIPAIPSTARWVQLTIFRNGGGNLGSSIQSIALNTGSSAPTASSNIMIDHASIIACTTSGLHLGSLISKNSLEQGGDEAWYCIQSIKDSWVFLDGGTNTPCVNGLGGGWYSTSYWGTTETVTTYIREPFRTALAASASDVVCAVQDSGSVAGGNITFSGGWNTSGWAAQDGETFLYGGNGNGVGFGTVSKNYLTIDHINTVRFGIGIVLDGLMITVGVVQTSGSNSTYNFRHTAGVANIADLKNLVHGSGQGLSVVTSHCYIANIGRVWGTTSYGMTNTANDVILRSAGSFSGNGSYDIYCTSGVTTVISPTFTGYAGSAIRADSGAVVYLFNPLVSSSVEFVTGNVRTCGTCYSTKHDQTLGNNWVFTGGGTWNSTATDRSGADAGEVMWRGTITSSDRNSTFPLKLPLRGFAVSANEARTLTVWMRKGHATNVAMKLVLPGGQIAGVASDVVATKASDTSWENVSINFTPTEAGVVVPEVWLYYVAANSTGDVGKVGIS